MSPRPSLRPLADLVLRTQPDSRLVNLFRQGQKPAFEEIVRRYRPALVAFAGGIVPRHQAEDVVQESFVRAHTALAGDNEIDVQPWLYTIVRNRALNAVRDEHPHEHLAEDYDGVPQPPDVFGKKEEWAGLVAALKALPEQQRRAIVKRELEGRSHEEIAFAMGATPGAVRGLIFRAREGLRTVGGFVVPSTLVDALLGSPGTTTAIGGVAAGGGAGFILKAGVAVTVGALAVGSGIAIHNGPKPRESIRIAAQPSGHHKQRATAMAVPVAHKVASSGGREAAGKSSGGASGRGPSSGAGPGGGSQPSNSGPGSSGEGSSSASGSDSSGTGGGSGGDDSPSGGGSGDRMGAPEEAAAIAPMDPAKAAAATAAGRETAKPARAAADGSSSGGASGSGDGSSGDDTTTITPTLAPLDLTPAVDD